MLLCFKYAKDLNYRHRNAQMASRASVEVHTLIYFRKRPTDTEARIVNQGLTVYGNKGSTDQHAYIQQLREGVHNFFATFIEVLRDRPLAMIGSLNQVSHVVTTCLECYRKFLSFQVDNLEFLREMRINPIQVAKALVEVFAEMILMNMGARCYASSLIEWRNTRARKLMRRLASSHQNDVVLVRININPWMNHFRRSL
ncbi:uncharacterized protein LOC114305825 [Camellia sinensis]|uniref:uncharacterized protein LOC114305825 n=1 Tax=Camellia sinensis TaxID=4442 RepID=UPI0010367095|nr:uncharacterized protein LOC114305825 [Camellia sinensis]